MRCGSWFFYQLVVRALPNVLSITSWNVEGLCGSLRKRIVRRWVTDQPIFPNILCFQEIKAKGFRLDVVLSMILLDHWAIILLPVQGNGETTILVHPKFVIEDLGNFLEGHVAWVIVS